MYNQLFNAVTDALAALARGDVIRTAALLKQGQRQAEETYLNGADDDSADDAPADEAPSDEGGAQTVQKSASTEKLST